MRVTGAEVMHVIESPSWMLVRLGLETQQYHAGADADRLVLMDADTRVAYRGLLARIFAFENPVEEALAAVCAPALTQPHARTHWLRRDLYALGLRPRDLDRLAHCAVRITSVTQALGWMFVLERHGLISGLILRHLEQRLDLDGASSYLVAQAEQPGARLRALCAAIDEHAAQHAMYPTLVVAAAGEAFRWQRHWYLVHDAEGEIGADVVSVRGERSRLRT